MNLKTNLANNENYGNQRNTSTIKHIVIHFTANDGDSDEGNANYFKGVRGVSAHYFVDNDSITQSVPDNYVAWAVGGNKYNDCTITGGGTYYNKCTNNNSISIELCDSVRNGVYDFTEGTLRNAIELTKSLIQKYNIPIDNVIRHFDVTGKICPKPFVDDVSKWKMFKQSLTTESNTSLYSTSTDYKKSIVKLTTGKIISTPNNWTIPNMKFIEILIEKVIEKKFGVKGYAEAINYMKLNGIISNPEIWTKHTYKIEHCEAMVIKLASLLP